MSLKLQKIIIAFKKGNEIELQNKCNIYLVFYSVMSNAAADFILGSVKNAYPTDVFLSFYPSYHSPFSKILTSFPSKVLAVMERSLVPIIKST